MLQRYVQCRYPVPGPQSRMRRMNPHLSPDLGKVLARIYLALSASQEALITQFLARLLSRGTAHSKHPMISHRTVMACAHLSQVSLLLYLPTVLDLG